MFATHATTSMYAVNSTASLRNIAHKMGRTRSRSNVALASAIALAHIYALGVTFRSPIAIHHQPSPVRDSASSCAQPSINCPNAAGCRLVVLGEGTEVAWVSIYDLPITTGLAMMESQGLRPCIDASVACRRGATITTTLLSTLGHLHCRHRHERSQATTQGASGASRRKLQQIMVAQLYLLMPNT